MTAIIVCQAASGEKQGSVKVRWDWESPLTHRLAVPPLPKGEGYGFDLFPSRQGRGGTARRWVRGFFPRAGFTALEGSVAWDFDGALGEKCVAQTCG